MQLASDGLHLQRSASRIVLLGPSIDAIVQSPHSCIELWNKTERPLTAQTVDVSRDHIYLLGVAPIDGQHVIVWNHANEWRKKQDLQPRTFFIQKEHTGLADGHIDLLSLIPCLLSNLPGLRQLGEIGLDHCLLWTKTIAYLDTKLQALVYDLQNTLATELILRWSDSVRGYLRLAGLHKATNAKLALLCYLQAIRIDPRLSDKLQNHVIGLRSSASWGLSIVEGELHGIPQALRPHLLQDWMRNEEYRYNDILWRCTTEKRAKTFYREICLPRFFSWLYPGRIAGMSHPNNEETIDLLCRMGITDVLTLSAESPVDPAWFQYKAINSLFIPVPNHCAPSIEEMDYIWASIEAGGVWLIHCGGGVGRAGTVLACIIAMLGDGVDSRPVDGRPCMDAQSSIGLLRQIRPTSLETDKQERFVAAWISHRWKLSHAHSEDLKQSNTPLSLISLHDNFSFDQVKVILLIGLPGAGKSWVASAIEKRRQRGSTIIISRDESGSRAACEAQLGRNYAQGSLLVLDHCNVSQAYRKKRLSLMDDSCSTIAVNFDYPMAVCQHRINTRFDHPTIRAGHGRAALQEMNQKLETATLQEGFMAIATISNFAAAREFVKTVLASPGLLKFPRTKHLLDLGAATSDDLVCSSFPALKTNISVEEKIDGANMGISLDYDGKILCQNRGHYIIPTYHAQFKSLGRWLDQHSGELHTLLFRDEQMPERFMLYGEWCVARHSVVYRTLPDRFLAFDFYDRYKDVFVSRRVLAELLKSTTIHQVPLLHEAESLTQVEVSSLLDRKSRYGDDFVEGLYIRMEDQKRKVTVDRGKVVRGDFRDGITEHWTKRDMEYNGIVFQA